MSDSTATSPKTARHRSLVAKVIDEVREMIATEGLRAGDVLPSEASVGERAGVSRVVVREAFRSMAALGIVDAGNGRRARVAAVDHSVLGLVMDHGVQTDQVSVQQVLDLRRTIELRTVALAAMLRSEREAEEIAAEAAAMRQHFADAERVMEHDIAFHHRIARATRNPLFAMVVESLQEITRRTWRIGWQARPTDEDRMQSVACHEAIAAAILKSDRAAGEALMANHFDNTTKMLLDSGIN
jgi:DNA-binding FadR family transcriptional regulator